MIGPRASSQMGGKLDRSLGKIRVESPRGSGSDRVLREERLVCEAETFETSRIEGFVWIAMVCEGYLKIWRSKDEIL